MIDCWPHTCLRWHANPWPALQHSGDSTDAHSNRMAKLALWLWPDASRELLAAIATHDDAEGGPGGTGDVPGPGKVGAFGYELEGRTDEIEIDRGTSVHLSAMDDTDAARLRFLDRLDAYRWVSLCEPRALSGDGWPEFLAWLLDEARRLGVLTQVEGVLCAT